MRFWILPLLLLLASCSSLNKKDKENAALHLQIGTGHLVNSNLPAALTSLLRSEELDPENPQTQNNLGLVYFLRDRPDMAEVHLRKAVALAPDFSEARNNLSRVYIERGKFLEAIKEATIVSQDLTYPNPDKPLVNIGLAYFKLNNFSSAQTSLEAAIKLNRDSCLAQTLLGRTLYELKRYQPAADQLDRAIGFCQSEQNDEAHYYAGLSYYQTGQVKKAEARLSDVISLYPQGSYKEKAQQMLNVIRR
jgi:type IV pilus assembly protein PilF